MVMFIASSTTIEMFWSQYLAVVILSQYANSYININYFRRYARTVSTMIGHKKSVKLIIFLN